MTRLLKEPLLHFLLLGAALFLAFGLAPKGTVGAPGKIVITREQVQSLATGFAQTWQRSPTSDELEGLIRDRVREEVYAREAIALGLDKDDTIIRRRLRQKMEFVSENVVAEAEPKDGELRAYLSAHADTFRIEPRFTFRHVYLDSTRRGPALAADARQLLSELNAASGGADLSRVGDPFLLDHTFDGVPAGVIARQFGEKFAATLGELALRRWSGPIESGYGAHLVFLSARTDGRIPAFEEAKDAVRVAWAREQRQEANEAIYVGMLKRYTVTIQRPQASLENP